MKAVRNNKYPKAQKGLAYKSKTRTTGRTTAADQAMKGSRVERGLLVRPEDYDMTTAAGRAAYRDDYRQSRENRLAQDQEWREKVQSGEMTQQERMAAKKDREMQNRETYSSRSPQRITLDRKPQKFDRDIRGAMQQRGSETSGLRQNERSVTGKTVSNNKVSVNKPKNYNNRTAGR